MVPTFFIQSTTYHNCSRFGFCVTFPKTVFLPNSIAWATYKTLLVYLASIKASASYHQIFVEFNQNCETTVETYIQTWTITTLSTFVPCVFLYVFTIFDARIETGKTRGQCFCTYQDAKIPMQLFWLDLSFKDEITSLITGLDLEDFEIFFKA